jgi:folate-dependent tRNA-U54 methylase TrmFO/GidA
MSKVKNVVFSNEPVEVMEVYYYLRYDEEGELHVNYFESEEEYNTFIEAFGESIEIFSETPKQTTKELLMEAMSRGISLLKLQLEKRQVTA